MLNFPLLIDTEDENIEAALLAAARKEIAYLEKFGRPLLPFRRERREYYEYKEQSPADHVKNLERYLLIIPLLVPNNNSALHRFCLKHPDLHTSNVIVSTSAESKELKIVGLLDWQHAAILPIFLHAIIPDRFQNYDDPVSQVLIPPSLPANMDELDQDEQSQAMELYFNCIVHFHYVKNMEQYNRLQHEALSDTVSIFIYRLYCEAGAPWEGETHELKSSLIKVVENWDSLTGEGVPCPVAFEAEDLRKTRDLSERLQIADENFELIRGCVGFESETWVTNEDYEKSKSMAELLKQTFLGKISDKEDRAKISANWLLDDMDEEDYF